MKLQVNATDYTGGKMFGRHVVIERFDGEMWSVPAWEEWGLGNLAGPFATVAEAQKALADFLAE